MLRKIVFINQATGYLTIDIINSFLTEFDKVALITGSVRVQNTELDPKIHVTKIIKYNRGGNVRKIISWIVGTLQIWFLLLCKYKDYERIYFTIPPTAYLLSLSHRTPFSIVIYDLYPEALLIHNFSRNSYFFKWWSNQNRKIFTKAHKIFTLSEYMKSLIQYYCQDSDICVIPNWSAFSRLRRIDRTDNLLINNEGLKDIFIVQYSGNIGLSHNVEVLLEVAESLKTEKDIMFIIIGRGEKSVTIGDLISWKRLTNCRLLPFRKDDELFDSLCAADLAVITLDDSIPDISVPSKIYNIMAAGTPVMAIASANSGLADIITRHRMGRVFDKENIIDICQFIKELKNDPKLWNYLSENSLNASRQYTIANATKYLNYYLEKAN